MGCVPIKKLEKSLSKTQTLPSIQNKHNKVFQHKKTPKIKSRFIKTLVKFRSDLNVIYEISSELETSVMVE